MSGGPTPSKHGTNPSLGTQSDETGGNRRKKKKKKEEDTVGLLWDLNNIPTTHHKKKGK